MQIHTDRQTPYTLISAALCSWIAVASSGAVGSERRRPGRPRWRACASDAATAAGSATTRARSHAKSPPAPDASHPATRVRKGAAQMETLRVSPPAGLVARPQP
jgi:hypothetical protein